MTDDRISIRGSDGVGFVTVLATRDSLIDQLRKLDPASRIQIATGILDGRIVALPELPKGSDDRLKLRQEMSIASISISREVALQEAADMIGRIQEVAFQAVTNELKQRRQ